MVKKTEAVVLADKPADIEMFDDAEWLEGLEDFDVTDAGTPRMKIIGDEAAFEDQSTSIMYDELEGVVLGFLKQRIMFDTGDGTDNSGPLCRSNDFKTGTPSVDFPIQESGIPVTPEQLEEGVNLSCADCGLKEWGTHPQRDTPWCSEQWVFIMMAKLDEGSDELSPVIITFKSSGLAGAKKFVIPFVRAKKPMFSSRVTISLDMKKNGSVKYSTPLFAIGEDTERSHWQDYADNFKTVRDYLKSGRSSEGTMTHVVLDASGNEHTTADF